MQEPPVAQRNDRIPPVLLLLSPSSRRITRAGELLLFIFFYSPPPLHLLVSPPSYFPPTPFPTLYLIFLLFTSFSPSYFLFLFTTAPSSSLFKLGKCCSLARPPLLHPLSLSMRILSSAVVFSSQSEHTDGLLFPPLLCWELSITEDSQSCSHNSDSASL